MARAQVREVSGPAAIRGIASPIDTFERVAVAPPSNLHQLADGLAALDSGLGDFMAKRKVKSDAADKQQAIKDAYVANGEGFDKGTKDGSISPPGSPAYMTWYKTTQGDVLGRKLQDQFSLAYQTWEGRNSGDPEAYKAFVGGFLKENLGDQNDPEVLAGLNPHIEQILNGGQAQFTKDHGDAVYGQALATHGASTTDHIERAEADSKASGKEIDYEGLWGTLMTEREEAIKRNKTSDVDSFLVDSIILQATESGNEDMLKMLDRKLPGSTTPMNYDLTVRDKVLKAKDAIQSNLAQTATVRAAAAEKADKVRHNTIVADVLTKVHADPNYQVPEETLKELSKRDPEFRSKLPGFRKQMQGDGIPEDPQALMEMWTKIDSGAFGKADLVELQKKGVIKDPDTLTKAQARVDAVANANKPEGILSSASAKDSIKLITNATGQGPMDFMDGVRGLTEDGNRALFDYRTKLLNWSTEHPNATASEKEQAAFDLGKTIRDSIKPDPTQTQQGLYPGAAPAAPAAAPEKAQAETAPAVAPVAEAPGAAPGAAPVDVSNERNTAIKELAKQYGVTEEEAGKLMLEEEQADPAPQAPTPGADSGVAPPGDPAAAADGGIFSTLTKAAEAAYQGNYLPDIGGMFKPSEAHQAALSAQGTAPDDRGSLPEETRTKLTNLLKSPPMLEDGSSSAGNTPVAPLLNLIGHTEGTDKGQGYNETLAYGAYTGGKVNLTGMTLDEVDQLQTRMLAHPNNTQDSSAAGRYQIIRTTLRGLRKEMGLSGDELYDKAMQDKMAMHLLDRRGFKQWQAGTLSDADFMKGLSAEWASLPKANGKGTYGGQRTGATPRQVLGALGEVRSGKGVQVASLDPSAGIAEATGGDVPQAYSKIPAKDESGQDQIAKFKEWNSDPVANEEATLKSVKPQLADVVRRAKTLSGQAFVAASGHRDDAMQMKAVRWGWSHTKDSDHLDGNAVDLWPQDDSGAVVFEPKRQAAIVKAMKQAAKEMGVVLDIGADWKNPDRPHFALKS